MGSIYDLFPYSPTPWGAWDKHSNVYDANEEGIGCFDGGSKSATALSNRNRAVECVNALEGVDDPAALMKRVREMRDTPELKAFFKASDEG